ncbi:MAG: CAP domain-containing protein [Candidatus Sericytochromatia bacterium]|nr:CAP domain-containing protein [Candidatus Sericytochromatia bacterium]
MPIPIDHRPRRDWPWLLAFTLQASLFSPVGVLAADREDVARTSQPAPTAPGLAWRRRWVIWQEILCAAQPQTPAKSTKAPYGAIEQDILTRTNAFRRSQGKRPVLWNGTLATIARDRSQDMAKRHYFSHIEPNGDSVFDRLKHKSVVFTAARENIAMLSGYPQTQLARLATDGWIKSSGHKANLVATDVTKLGVGVAKRADGTYYLTQLFAN